MYIPEPMTSDEINEMLDYVEQLESDQATDWRDAQEQFFDLYEFTRDGLPNCIGDITIY